MCLRHKTMILKEVIRSDVNWGYIFPAAEGLMKMSKSKHDHFKCSIFYFFLFPKHFM